MSENLCWLIRLLLVTPIALLAGAALRARQRAGEIAAALQSPQEAEPALAKLGSLLADADIAAAQVAFRNTASETSGTTSARMDGTQTGTAPARANGT